MKHRQPCFVWTCLVLFPVICRAADAVHCPATIAVRQELTSTITGWTPLEDDTPHSLAGITFYDGPPAEKASLVYDQITRAKGEQVATWSFAPQKDRPIWATCSYAGTAIQLARSLPQSITTCAVRYDPQQQIAGLPLIKNVSCR